MIVRSSFKPKDTQPSASMLPSDGRQYICRWLNDSLTIHSDGNVSCGLDDAHALRSFGNLHNQTVAEVFANPEIEKLQRKLSKGHRCRDCSLYEAAEISDQPRSALPSTLVIEPSVKCNLRCPNAACIPNNLPGLQTRDRTNLDEKLFRRVIDEVQNSLRHVYFFNYGDPFIHPGAEEMLFYLRQKCPGVQIVTSTNGIPLAANGRAEKVVKSEIDHIVFTISGVRQDSYEKYHVGGSVEKALQGLANVCHAKSQQGFERPQIVWRYLVFRWNDSDDELDAAIALAKTFGVDQFSLYLTNIPEESCSYRLSPGTPGYAKYRKYIDAAHGYRCPREYVDENGLYGVEENGERVRWTNWTARLPFRSPGRFLSLRLNTVRPPGSLLQSVFVIVPWGSFKYELKAGEWRDVVVRVPRAYRKSDFVLCLMTPEYWFPADYGSDDLRCLGCLVGVSEKGDFAQSELRLLSYLGESRGAKSAAVPADFRLLDLNAWSEPAIVDGAGRFVKFGAVQKNE